MSGQVRFARQGEWVGKSSLDGPSSRGNDWHDFKVSFHRSPDGDNIRSHKPEQDREIV
jgi:hypothetical protein